MLSDCSVRVFRKLDCSIRANLYTYTNRLLALATPAPPSEPLLIYMHETLQKWLYLIQKWREQKIHNILSFGHHLLYVTKVAKWQKMWNLMITQIDWIFD